MVNPFRRFWRWLRRTDIQVKYDFLVGEEKYLRDELYGTRKERARLLTENLHLKLVLRTVNDGVPRMRFMATIEQQGLLDDLIYFPSVLAIPPEQNGYMTLSYMRPMGTTEMTNVSPGYVYFRVAIMPRETCGSMWAVPCDMLADGGPEVESVVRGKIREMLSTTWNEFSHGMEDRIIAALGAPTRLG